MAHVIPANPKIVIFRGPAWSARCDCYDGHRSNSGRCNCRSTKMPDGSYTSAVIDPTRFDGDKAICEECRANCPAGSGDRLDYVKE